MKNIITLLLLTLLCLALNAQENNASKKAKDLIDGMDELLDDLDNLLVSDGDVGPAFKGLKIVNIESTKMAAKGDFYFMIAHRFATVKNGFRDLFGIDRSNIRFSFIYGFTDWLTAGVSRSSYEKTFDGHLKLKLATQKEGGFPFNIVSMNALAYVAGTQSLNEFQYPLLEEKHRFNYLTEVLISRKLNNNLSLQLSPMLFHENLTLNNNQENTQFLTGIGGRYKLSKRVTLNADYIYHFNRHESLPAKNNLSVGLDIDTGGHVFQLHVTNSRRLNDTGFLHADGDWSKGDVFLGFNLYRVF